MSLFLILLKSWVFLKICLLCNCQMNYWIYRVKLTRSYWSVKLVATGWKSCPAGNSNKWQHHSKNARSCCETIQSGLHLNAWLRWEVILGDLWNFWIILGPSMALQFNKTQVWKVCGLNWPLPKCSMKIHFIKSNHPIFFLVLLWQFPNFTHISYHKQTLRQSKYICVQLLNPKITN